MNSTPILKPLLDAFSISIPASFRLVAVLVEQFPDLRALLKHLEFDAVYIRDDFLKHITTGRTTEAI